jgi:hypothetical protein
MQQLVTDIRPLAELAYFVATIVLAVAAVLGLKQVSVLKRDIRLRNDRAAKEKAIEYSHRYLTAFVALDAKVHNDLRSKGFTRYKGPVGDFTPQSLGGEHRQAVSKKAIAVVEAWLPALNELQSIASAFITGVADERVGFEIIGRTFCASVRANYDILAMVRSDKVCPYYQSIVSLYGIWAPRMSKAELSALSEDLASKMRGILDSEVPPIGVSE